jgi:hypothetical protein
MKVIGFEEHYRLPAKFEAAIKTNDGSQRASMIWGRRGSLPWTTPVSTCRSFRTLRRAP